MADDEYAMLCPTCGGLPVDAAERIRLRAALEEVLHDLGMAVATLEGASVWNAEAVQRRRLRIAELRKEFGL